MVGFSMNGGTVRWLSRFFCISGLLLASAACQSSGKLEEKTNITIENVCVVIIEKDIPCERKDVLIEGDRIAAVEPPGMVRHRGGIIIPGDDYWLMPGLWDMHVHALWDESVYPVFFEEFLAYGIIGVRDMGGRIDLLPEVRKQIADGTVTAPYLVAAGSFLDGPKPVDPSLSIIIAEPSDIDDAVTLARNAGADFLKTYSMLPDNVADELFEEAAVHGLPVSGHWPISWTIDMAVNLASIEHLRAEVGGYCAGLDATACKGIVDQLAESGVRHVPTLTVRRNRLWLENHVETKAAALESLPQIVTEYWLSRESGDDLPAEERQRRTDDYAELETLMRQLYERGTPIMAGTDTGEPFVLPGASLIEELERYQTMGIPPADILRIAVTEPVSFLGLDEQFGRVEPGMQASLILLPADPKKDVSTLRNRQIVIHNGEFVYNDAAPAPLSYTGNSHE